MHSVVWGADGGERGCISSRVSDRIFRSMRVYGLTELVSNGVERAAVWRFWRALGIFGREIFGVACGELELGRGGARLNRDSCGNKLARSYTAVHGSRKRAISFALLLGFDFLNLF